MRLKISQFAGMSEAVSARLLDDKFATNAVNCRVDSGALEPLRGMAHVKSLPIAAKSIYRYTQDDWLTWSEDVDVIKTPVAYDTTDRICYSGDGYPKQTRNDIAFGAGVLPANFYRLGVPVPATTASINVTGAADPEQAGLESTVYYVVTFVTAWGEEGPPSDPSAAAVITDGQEVTLTLPSVPSGEYSFGQKRIYRSSSGTSATAFQFLADVDAATNSYVDTTPAAELGEVIPSTLWDAPPNDDLSRYPTGQMKGLTLLDSGVAVGFSGNTLVYSEAYLPYAWPYAYPIQSKIKGVAVTQQGVLVTTEGKPVLAIGTDPRAVSLQPLDERRACVSKRSVVDMGEYAVYASPDGLVGIENGSVNLLTDGLFRRDQWQQFAPESISAFRWEGKYVAFYDDGAGNKGGFIFEPGNQTSAFIKLDFFADAGFYDESEDTLYLAVGTDLYRFNAGTLLTYEWKSKEYQLPRPASFSCIQVFADSYPVDVRLICDGHEEIYSVASDRPQRLKAKRADVVQFRLVGSDTVHSVAIAQSVEELKDA